MSAVDSRSLEELTQVAQRREFLAPEVVHPLRQRTDIHGLLYAAGHYGALAGTGYLVFLSNGTWWLLPAMLIHGIVLNHLFAPVHECAHGTAFKTRWLNEGVLWVSGILTFWAPLYFRYEHWPHHNFTQEHGKDTQFVLASPKTSWDYVKWISGYTRYKVNLGWLILHSMGRMRPQEKKNIPPKFLPQIYLEARVMLVIYVGAALYAVIAQSWLPVVYWLGPLILTRPLAHFLRAADHVGCYEGPDLRRNTRTVMTDPITRFFSWNMSYHSEHHVAPAVPFHALPKVHKLIDGMTYNSRCGYWAVQWDILRHHLTGRSQTPEDLPDDGRRRPTTQTSHKPSGHPVVIRQGAET